MRLSSREAEVIPREILRVAENEQVVAVHLFGSRADDQARGGDIDLWVETLKRPNDARLFARRIRLALELAIGEQKVDVMIASASDPTDDAQAAFLRHISMSRVTLWPKKPT